MAMASKNQVRINIAEDLFNLKPNIVKIVDTYTLDYLKKRQFKMEAVAEEQMAPG